MDEAPGASPGAGWPAALGLTVAVIFLSVFGALPLVVLPLSILLLALPTEARGKQAALGVLLGVAVVALPAGPLVDVSRGWALVIGGGFLLSTILRPGWGVFPRALASVAAAVCLAGVALLAMGGFAALDATVREHFASASSMALESFGSRVQDGEMAAQWRSAMEQVARVQWLLFPGVLVLESLAALALAAWWAGRIRAADPLLAVRPLREFRFDDQLVWALIVGLVLVVAPFGAMASRAGANVLFVMLALYALRGAAVFVFLSRGAVSVLTVLFAVLVTIFLYPLVLTAAVLVGLGDTWLDVRGRAVAARQA